MLNLDSVATQTQFGKLVGISQQSVCKLVDRETLTRGASYITWLHEYTENLRTVAAGYGTEDAQKNLTAARIAETESKTALNRVKYHEEIGTLIQADECSAVLFDWCDFTNREIPNAFKKLVAKIADENNIDIDEGLATSAAGTIIERIKNHSSKLARSIDEGSREV